MYRLKRQKRQADLWGVIVNILSEIDITAKIEWSEDLARFVIIFEDIQADFDNYYSSELEVIGDIYNDWCLYCKSSKTFI